MNKSISNENFLSLLELRHLYLLAVDHQKSRSLGLHTPIFITEALKHSSCDLVFLSLEAHSITPLASLIFPINVHLETSQHL